MISVQDGFMIVLGIIACFAGYSMFHEMLPLWGFILGGWLTYTMLPAFFPINIESEILYIIITFGIGGLIGAIIATPAYYVIVFLSGAALGMLMGIMTGALIETGGISSFRQLSELSTMSFPPVPQTLAQYVLMVIFGLILGVVAVNFQKFMICASSAFLGAAALITGMGGSITAFTKGGGQGAVMLAGWVILGLIGLIFQFRSMGEV